METDNEISGWLRHILCFRIQVIIIFRSIFP